MQGSTKLGAGRNPWTKLSTRPIYGNPWFRVREDQVLRPDGSPGIYGVVMAARWALGILPLWPDSTLTLVGQFRYAIGEYSWEIPEGGGDLDREPLDGAKRELLEETGLEASSWTYLGRCHTSNCFVDEVGHLYLAEGLAQGAAQPGPDEELVTQRVPVREALRMAQDGRITDAISVAAVFRLACHLKILEL
jgi:8-oxo-dGTP pyrophosphatase MutT (NUDIX family)